MLKGCCRSVNPPLCCPLRGCRCLGAQLTEEHLVCGSQRSLGMNLCRPSGSYQGAEPAGLFWIFLFITELTSSWYWLMIPLNRVGPEDWGDALNYTLRRKSAMASCNLNYSTFPTSFPSAFLQTFTPLPNVFSPPWISSRSVLCEAGPLRHMPMTLQLPVGRTLQQRPSVPLHPCRKAEVLRWAVTAEYLRCCCHLMWQNRKAYGDLQKLGCRYSSDCLRLQAAVSF